VKRIFNSREPATDEIQLYWRKADELTLYSTRALYLVRRKGSRAISYIGRAGRQSVKARWKCRSKDKWAELERDGTTFAPLVCGLFTTRKITPKLIQDVERLLIFMIQPILNSKGRTSCVLYHRELTVTCAGEWPYPRSTFHYRNNLPHSLVMSSG
jgi:hypothetical protein